MSEFREKLVSPKVYEENLKNYLEKMKEVKEIIIWGAIAENIKVYNFLERYHLAHKVIGYADNDSKKWGKYLNNKKVLSPTEVLERAKIEDNLYIIINALPKSALIIKSQLVSMGIGENKIDVEETCHMSHFYLVEIGEIDNIEKHIDEYEKVYFMLEDERSKEIYLSKLNYILSADSQFLKDLTNDNEQYFDKELIHLRKDEVFVDCGSFNGDTLDVFYKLTKGNFKKYIAIEADSGTYKELIEKIKDKQYINITILNKACWYEQTELRFNARKTGTSSVIENGNVIVKADKLDHLIDKPVTFIKMDIEGAEENALKGAEKLIRRYKPILAICIYHNAKDYYKLPLLIKEFNQEYKIFIRHYKNNLDAETVCYAIPKERCL